MKYCPITGVNLMRFSFCVLGGFAFLFLFDYIVHQILLMDLYEQTAQLWRAPEETSFALMMLRNLILVKILALIFTRHYEEKGVGEGLRFGLLMGLLLALLMSSSYIWMPISLTLALGWAASGFLTGLGLGVIFSLIYRK